MYEELAEMALDPGRRWIRPLILAALARAETLLGLADSRDYRCIVYSLALHLQAYLMRSGDGQSYLIQGDRIVRGEG